MPSPASSPRPDSASLFDATHHTVRRTYGERERPLSVTIRTVTGLTVSMEIPHSWEIQSPQNMDVEGQDAAPLLNLRSPQCVAEILATLIDVGHRLTRMAIVEEMERRGRRWGESMAGEMLTQLVRLGVLTNTQSGPHKGYGLPDW